MKMITKIAIAIDDSSSAIHTINYAIELANQVNAKIEIISIIKHSIGNIDAGILPEEIESKNIIKVKKLIENIKKIHTNVIINEFETVGIPEKKISNEIKKWNADLLILGHHTHSFIERLFINSVEKRLINHIKCPILIIPETTKL